VAVQEVQEVLLVVLEVVEVRAGWNGVCSSPGRPREMVVDACQAAQAVRRPAAALVRAR